jgi:hypothetical protein
VEAQEALVKAISVLNEFYAKAGQATSFVQLKTFENQPAIFNEAYTGMGEGD